MEDFSEKIVISNAVSIPLHEVSFQAIRAQGAGGQNVNKVSSAIHLRFDISQSSLPDFYKDRLLALNDQRITKEGVVVLKSQEHRTQERNRYEACLRLQSLIRQATKVVAKRLSTRPTLASKKRRLESKNQRSKVKNMRSKIDW
ncbi:alternative ribosome rescue aminoacyl-tRNA hydrolase ArfB [Sessilibacter sp. MAH2]